MSSVGSVRTRRQHFGYLSVEALFKISARSRGCASLYYQLFMYSCTYVH